MKKALAILMAFAMVASALFAEGMPAPTLTYGFSGDAEVSMIKENSINTGVESGEPKPVAKSEPMGLKATKFVAKTWANMDWALASIKTEGKWDAFRSNGDDWSYMKVSSTWKDLFGFKFDYNIELRNKNLGATDPSATKMVTTLEANEMVMTLDKLSSDGFKFWTKYDANNLIKMVSVTAGEEADNFLDNFKEIGFEINNDEFAGKLVYNTANITTLTPATGTATLDTAQFEAKKLFGVWTALVNSGDEKKIRVGNLGTDAKTDRNEFVVGKDNKLQDGTKKKMNIFNTLTPVENLTVKSMVVAPFAATTVADWLYGENMNLGVDYALADVGTIGAGVFVKNDYVKATYTAPVAPATIGTGTSGLSAFHTAAKQIDFGNAFWLDAKLDKALGEKIAVYAGFDAQLGKFYKYTKTATDTVSQIQLGDVTKYEVNLEAKITSVDKLELLAGAALRGQMGYSYAKANPNSTNSATDPVDNVWADDMKPAATAANNFYTSSFNEANYVLKEVVAVKPFELKLKATYNVGGDTLSSVWVKNTFTALDVTLYGNDPDGAGPKTADAAITGGRLATGFVDKNAVEVGLKLKSGAKSSLTISANYNLYLGVPTVSNLTVEGDTNTDDLKAAYGAWVSSKFNPFEAKVAYTYSY